MKHQIQLWSVISICLSFFAMSLPSLAGGHDMDEVRREEILIGTCYVYPMFQSKDIRTTLDGSSKNYFYDLSYMERTKLIVILTDHFANVISRDEITRSVPRVQNFKASDDVATKGDLAEDIQAFLRSKSAVTCK